VVNVEGSRAGAEPVQARQAGAASSKGSKRRQTLAHAATSGLASPLGLPQHADQHRSKDTVLLAVDQQLAGT
jgi:uncharacterized protein YfaQ (DUF2300 family)